MHIIQNINLLNSSKSMSPVHTGTVWVIPQFDIDFSPIRSDAICFTADLYGWVGWACLTQEAKYVERWPNTVSAWAVWSRFDIPVDRYGRLRSQLICTSITLGSSTCHQASQQENTY
jgi:hypothetical protein